MDEIESAQLLEDVFKAYYDARKNKRNTQSQLLFEVNLESNLIDLYHELKEMTYRPGPSICFIVSRPVKREVFASQFRDRVVHHLLYNYIAPVFEKRFIHDSYSCRKDKGTSFGIDRLDHHIRSCTNNYQTSAWILKLDLRGYFMNINKQRLYGIVMRTLERHWDKTAGDNSQGLAAKRDFVEYLIRSIIFNDPTEGAVLNGRPTDWDQLPLGKSLMDTPDGVGLPIGDLTSQLFSNIYLGVFDDYVKRVLRIKHYGRYVDDFFVVHRSKGYLLELIPQFREFLDRELGLTIHPDKVYLQEYTKGVAFLGSVIKPHRRYVGKRTVRNFKKRVEKIENYLSHTKPSGSGLEYSRSVLNSYLGYMGAFKSYRIISKTLKDSIIGEHFIIAGGYNKLIIPPRTRVD